MKKGFMNWSGGKDCTLALHKVFSEKKLSVEFLFTSFSRQFQRVSMHGIRKELITMQARSIGISSRKLYLPENTDMPTYDRFMQTEMELMKERGIKDSIFGDIFLEDLRNYREEKLKTLSIESHFPLWKKGTKELIHEFIGLGYRAIIVSIDKQKLDEQFLGKELSLDLINELPANVDPCGENGEFHTFVFEGPIFKQPIKIVQGERTVKEYKHEGQAHQFAFLDILPSR